MAKSLPKKCLFFLLGMSENLFLPPSAKGVGTQPAHSLGYKKKYPGDGCANFRGKTPNTGQESVSATLVSLSINTTFFSQPKCQSTRANPKSLNFHDRHAVARLQT